LVTLAWSAPARATAKAETRVSLATEVCEDTVRSAIEAAISARLPTPQTGRWVGTGRTRYVCIYDLGDGRMTLTVQIVKSTSQATTTYGKIKDRAKKPTRLNGLGQAAYQAADGTIVARKDRFVLTIDPTALPARVTKADVAFAAVVAVLSCWTGES
jgi:hypothetical protein